MGRRGYECGVRGTGSKEPRTVPYTRTPPNPYPYRTRTVHTVLLHRLSAILTLYTGLDYMRAGLRYMVDE
jgi:hypothetical protein